MARRGLELTLMQRADGVTATVNQVVKAFEARSGIPVQITWLSWETGWLELVERVVHGRPPDVSEVGSTWVQSLRFMEALRPFQAPEVRMFGGTAAFFPLSIRTVSIEGAIWAIPWLVDPRLIFYWSEMADRAGVTVNPQETFSTPRGLEEALVCLDRSGVPMPWVVPTRAERNTVHHIAIWIWGQGGDFVSPDGQVVTFAEGPALEGIIAYFRLGRWMGRPLPLLSALEADRVFLDGHAAMTIGGLWIWAQIPAERRSQVSCALPPGPPFVGGSHLVIWKDTRDPEAALRLVNSLMQHDFLHQIAASSALLPARVEWIPEALAALAFDPMPVIMEAIHRGRSLPPVRLWGVIEERLRLAFGAIWQEMAAGAIDPVPVVQRHLIPLAVSLNRMIQS